MLQQQDTVPVGYTLCAVQQCASCNGTGEAMVGNYTAAGEYGYGVTPREVPCGSCIQGFRFAAVSPEEFFIFMLRSILEGGAYQSIR